MKKALLVAFFVMASVLTSCNLEDDRVNFHFVTLKIVSAELPETFKLNHSYEIKVTYIKPNNCTFFEGFEINRSGTTERNVVAVGSELEDTACAQVADEAVDNFYFTCYYSEPYLFRFWTGQDENGEAQFIEYEVPVTP